MCDGFAFGEEFVGGLLETGLGDFVVDLEAGDWGVVSWGGGAWHGEHQTLWDAVKLAVTLESNGLPLAASESPVAHVVDGSVTCGCSAGELSKLDDFSSTLLDTWGEFVLDPGIGNHVCGVL